MIEYPSIPVFPEPLRGRHVVHVRFATTDLEAGPELVRPWQDVAVPIFDHLGEIGYEEVGSIYREPDFAPSSGTTCCSASCRRPCWTPCANWGGGKTAPVGCIVDLRHLGGAMSRPPQTPNAVPFREAQYILRVLSGLDGVEEEDVRAAHQRVYDAVARWTIGRSLNFVHGRRTDDELVEQV